MDYLDENGVYSKEKVIGGIVDIDKKIHEECNKDVVDGEELTRLRYEQMLRGLYLWQNPYSF